MPTLLPLVPSIASYRFSTTLEAFSEGSATEPRNYVFDVRWNARAESWYMDILAADETPIRMGIRLVLGTLLGGRSVSLAFPAGALRARDLSNEGREAAFDDLGTRVVVYYFTEDELAEPDV